MRDRRNLNELRTAGGRGFTMIELLVVMGIIALLIGITVAVRATMVNKASESQTENTIRVLEAALDAYIAETGSIPPPVVDYPQHAREFAKGDRDKKDIHVLPVTDAVHAHDENHLINSCGLFVQQVSTVRAADELIKTIDPSLLQMKHSFEPPEEDGAHENFTEAMLPTPMDAWGNPIRYVHPALDGILDNGKRAKDDAGDATAIDAYFPSVSRGFFVDDLRRNKITEEEYPNVELEDRDSDGGQCPSDRPYFYSAGPDGDPSTVEDNVYTVQPRFVKQDL